MALQVALVVNNLPANAEDIRVSGSIPGSGRSPGGGCGNPLQYSCLEKPQRQRNLVGYSPWGHKDSDRTERLSTAQHTTCKIDNALVSYLEYCNLQNFHCKQMDLDGYGKCPEMQPRTFALNKKLRE